MDWDSGYTSIYYVTRIDPVTWGDVERIEISSEGSNSIKKSLSDLRESATLQFKDYSESDEIWIRIWMDTYQNGGASHDALFTGLACAPSRSIKGNYSTSGIECYSVLKPAQDVLLDRGWYAPEGADPTDIIYSLLENTPAPVSITDGMPKLVSHLIAEDGENALSMTDKLLDSVGWRMYITGYGKIEIGPYVTAPLIKLDAVENDIVEQSLSVTYDYYDCPNVFRAVAGDDYYIARDDDPLSKCSTVSRGREIWAEETNCGLNDGETLVNYAERRLKELQQKGYVVEYKRRFVPGVYPASVVSMHYPAQGIDGNFFITSQDLDLQFGCPVSEEVQKL